MQLFAMTLTYYFDSTYAKAIYYVTLQANAYYNQHEKILYIDNETIVVAKSQNKNN